MGTQKEKGRDCRRIAVIMLCVVGGIEFMARYNLMAEMTHSQSSKKREVRYAFPVNISNFRQLEAIDLNLPKPKNLNIVIVGDSLSRYQYVSLAYFLKFGEWINMKHPISLPPNETNQNEMYTTSFAQKAVPHMGLIWKNFWDSRTDHSNAIGKIMNGTEICDCFDPNVVQWDKNFGVIDVMNRYFRDPVSNNSVTYFQKYGDHNNYNATIHFKSRWSLDEVNGRNKKLMGVNRNNDTSINSGTSMTPANGDTSTYATNNWTVFILDFVANLDPKPNVFVFNQGWWLWENDEFTKPQVYEGIIHALKNAGIKSMYKTTTAKVNAGPSEPAMYEKRLCQLADFCLDLSGWTALVPEYLYADGAHFWEPVYSWMNVAMLDVISSSFDLG